MNGSWDSGAEYKVNVWPRELYEAQKRASGLARPVLILSVKHRWGEEPFLVHGRFKPATAFGEFGRSWTAVRVSSGKTMEEARDAAIALLQGQVLRGAWVPT